ncbi:MAG: hypothetical protein CME88_06720 [Hirschia sp.]|nr:hypothetical protein [Hirschia sp.]MBF18055.1 hypothetical protein [Hirschia sp.]
MSSSPGSLSPSLLKALVLAAIAEIVCIGGGVAMWFQTDKVIWIVIGVVASLGFSLPAVIQLVRARKGQN